MGETKKMYHCAREWSTGICFFACSGIKYCGLILLLSKRSGCDEIRMRPRVLGQVLEDFVFTVGGVYWNLVVLIPDCFCMVLSGIRSF